MDRSKLAEYGINIWEEIDQVGIQTKCDDECVFYHGTTIFIVYTDDTILLGLDKKEIESIYKKFNATFKIEDQGDLSDYLGIKIIRNSDGTMEWLVTTNIDKLNIEGIRTSGC